MTFTLVFHSLAEADIDHAYNWYEDQQQGLGEEFLKDLAICYLRLLQNPHAYSKTNKYFRKAALHRFPYIVAFEISESEILIYAIFDTRRDPVHLHKRK